MTTIPEKLNALKATIPNHVELIAVSKTKPNELILDAYNAGQRHFGENKAQDVQLKQAQLPQDIKWHFIGHLQSNKVKYIAPFIYLIHSVDSIKILKEINKRAKENNRTIKCLLQIKIAKEDTKFGLTKADTLEIVANYQNKAYQHVEICGLMGMATNTPNNNIIVEEFNNLNSCFDELKNSSFKNFNSFNIRSMGMTNDYKLAIENQSTMVRIGSAIFGVRDVN